MKGNDTKNVQGLLRHANVSTTLGLYAQSMHSSMVDAQESMLKAILRNGSKRTELNFPLRNAAPRRHCCPTKNDTRSRQHSYPVVGIVVHSLRGWSPCCPVGT